MVLAVVTEVSSLNGSNSTNSVSDRHLSFGNCLGRGFGTMHTKSINIRCFIDCPFVVGHSHDELALVKSEDD